MEKLRIQQEQTLGTLDKKIDAMMERQTQAIMDMLDGLLGSRNGSKDGELISGEPNREPRVNLMNNRIGEGHMDPLEEGAVHPAMPQVTIGHAGPKHQVKFNWQQTDLKRTTDARYTCDWDM